MKRALVAVSVGLLLLGPAATAQETDPGPLADVTLSMEGPATTPLVGTDFTLVYQLGNNGPEAASETVFSQYIPAELKLLSTTSSDTADSCTTGGEEQPETTADPPPEPAPAGTAPGSADAPESGTGTAAPGYYGDSVTCALGTLNVGETTVVTLELRRIAARQTYTSAWVGSSLNDPAYENNYADIAIDPDTSNPADVGITIAAPNSPDVGSDFTYTMTVTNNGPSTATSTSVFNPMGYGLSFVSVGSPRAGDNCELVDYSTPGTAAPEYGGYSEIFCDLASLAPNESVTIQVGVNRATAYEIWTGASVQTANYDEVYDNDYAYFHIPADASVTSDLGLDITTSDSVPLVGDQFDLVFEITNRGPAASGDTWLSTYLPPGLELVSVDPADRCSTDGSEPAPMADAPTAAPSETKGEAYYPIYSGLWCAIGTLENGASTRVNATVRRTSAKEIWNSGWVSSSNYDPNYENNYSDLMLAADKSNPADVAITMTAPTKPDVGADFAFTLEVTNNGPSVANDVTVTDYLPFGVDGNAVSSSDATDTCTLNEDRYDIPPPGSASPTIYGLREVRCELGSMASDEKTTITIDVTRTTEYEIWNSAWVYTSNYDSDYENDYASVLVEGEPYYGVCPADGDARGTAGSDQMVVGPCLAETAAGADSVDVVPASSGDSIVRTGAGPDTINVNLSIGSSVRRTIKANGGRGADTIRINVSPGAGNATIFVNGGAGPDTIEVDVPAGVKRVRIVIAGGSGKDQVNWMPGADQAGGRFPGLRIDGGAGVDLLNGGFGNDLLSGGDGGDRLYGSLGNDELRGGPGYDICRGGPGNNTTFGC